jgi:hypothetical protein
MKKNLFLMIAAIVLFGCKEEDEEVLDSLTGTVWVFEQSIGSESMSETLRFTDDEKVTIETKLSDGKTSVTNTFKGTYTYSPPTIAFLFSSNGESVSFKMTLKGNRIEYINSDNETVVYRKK